jgi:hypothetical protein
LLKNKHLSEKERIQQAYLAVFQRQPTSAEIKHADKFIKAEADLLASALPEQVVERTSTPEPETRIPEVSPALVQLASPTAPPAATTPAATNLANEVAPPGPGPASNTVSAAAPPTGDAGGNFGGGGGGGGGRGGFRGPRTFKGPGSASDIVVGKLAPGIAQPKVFHQALPEKPETPEEGAFALFTQALFGSAEFRYLQ